MQIYDCEIGVVKCFAVYFQKSLVYGYFELLKNESFIFFLTIVQIKVTLIPVPEKSTPILMVKIEKIIAQKNLRFEPEVFSILFSS